MQIAPQIWLKNLTLRAFLAYAKTEPQGFANNTYFCKLNNYIGLWLWK